MNNPRDRLVRVRPGVYRRGDSYVVRLKDASGRQRQITTNSRTEAERVKRLAEMERDDRRRRARVAAALLETADVSPDDLAGFRWGYAEPERGRLRRSKRGA
jgi:hypothetical protein